MLSGKAYENLIVKNDKFTEDTLICLGLVKKYIARNDLIIVGGMAIDMAMRLKGSQLYDDNALPDYDFFSPHHSCDAYRIAEMLYKAGMRNITVINANHVSTMRVRVNYEVVADVTYIPPNVYDVLPTLTYKELRIIHPHFQMIDQHKSMSLPYENPPWEVIFHRWKKDAKRYDLLYKLYPLKKRKELLDVPVNKFELNTIKISGIFQDQCIGGFSALVYWIEVARKLKFKSGFPSIGSAQIDAGIIVVQIPKDSHGVTFYSNDIQSVKKTIEKKYNPKKIRMYHKFLDKIPFKIIIDDFELLDNAGCMLSAHKTQQGFYVANLQNVLMYMLTNYILLGKMKNTNRGYSFYIGYLAARELVMWASKDPKKRKHFMPTPEVYGTSEMSDSYINSKRLFLESIREIPTRQLQPMRVFSDTFKNGKIPSKFYKFNQAKSLLFQFGGNPSKTYINRIYLT